MFCNVDKASSLYDVCNACNACRKVLLPIHNANCCCPSELGMCALSHAVSNQNCCTPLCCDNPPASTSQWWLIQVISEEERKEYPLSPWRPPAAEIPLQNAWYGGTLVQLGCNIALARPPAICFLHCAPTWGECGNNYIISLSSVSYERFNTWVQVFGGPVLSSVAVIMQLQCRLAFPYLERPLWVSTTTTAADSLLAQLYQRWQVA